MPLTTTVIGSYPKPEYVTLPDWFKVKTCEQYDSADYSKHVRSMKSEELEEQISRGQAEIVESLTSLGIDIITDGEVKRENYVYHFCRGLYGIDFDNTVKTTYRNGACIAPLACVRRKVKITNRLKSAEEWMEVQKISKRPVKYTLPGPMTIIGTLYNDYYQDIEEFSKDLVEIINHEVKELEAAGCKYIQIDEPLLVREPETALKYGIEHLKQCFNGVGPSVEKTIHLCCGYPSYLNQDDYMKAEKNVYKQLAPVLDEAGFDAVSLEDAHRYNDLDLFDMFKKTKIILGVVKIASTQVETVDEIKSRIAVVLKHVPPERLYLAPDCGLALLPVDILKKKLSNLVEAARYF